MYDTFVKILKEELVPAMGCTEPISLAYASSKAREVLDDEVISAVLYVSPNIVKNVKSVTVPHTGGLVGLKAAFLVGLIAGDPNLELEVLSKSTLEDEVKVKELMDTFDLKIEVVKEGKVFDIGVRLIGKTHSSYVRICDDHTNIVTITRDENVILSKEILNISKEDRELLTIENIYEFASILDINDVKDILQRQIDCNYAIAEEGIKNNWGANIGKVYLSSNPNSIECKAKAYAAAGSDARMNGCEMPVVINSGSGNQGMTASVPVIVYAKELNKTQEELYRALALSNLVTIHLKSGIGTLSAYCGVVSAGAGCASGIAYLLGKSYEDICHVIINTLAIDSGIICDGAKASCAAKIATAVETGFLGIKMHETGNEFYAGCGIVKEGVENTIKSVSRLASKGMLTTDEEIIRIMLDY